MSGVISAGESDANELAVRKVGRAEGRPSWRLWFGPRRNTGQAVDAVTRGDLARVKELLAKNPDLVQFRTPRSATLLHLAAGLDEAAVATYLIENGADINAVRDDGHTPLFEAGLAVARVLVGRGAKIDHTAPDGFSPISLALHRETRRSSITCWRNAKLELPPPGSYRRFVAIEAAMRFAESGVFALVCGLGLDKSFENEAVYDARTSCRGEEFGRPVPEADRDGAPVDRVDVFGWTPLHTAASEGNLEVVDVLVRRGVNKGLRTVDGKTAYVLAQDAKKVAVADYLAAHGADKGGATPPTLSGPYLGQKPPGRTPVPFVPGIPNIEAGRHGIFAFTLDGREAYWKPRWSPLTAIAHSQMTRRPLGCSHHPSLLRREPGRRRAVRIARWKPAVLPVAASGCRWEDALPLRREDLDDAPERERVGGA